MPAGDDRHARRPHRRLRVERGRRQRLPTGRPDPPVHHHRSDRRVPARLRQHRRRGDHDPPPDPVPGSERCPRLLGGTVQWALGPRHQPRRPRRPASRPADPPGHAEPARRHGRAADHRSPRDLVPPRPVHRHDGADQHHHLARAGRTIAAGIARDRHGHGQPTPAARRRRRGLGRRRGDLPPGRRARPAGPTPPSSPAPDRTPSRSAPPTTPATCRPRRPASPSLTAAPARSSAPMTPVDHGDAAAADDARHQVHAAADGFISGIRFYKGAGNTGTHTGTLYDGSGATLATGDLHQRDRQRLADRQLPERRAGRGRHHLRRRLLRARTGTTPPTAASSRTTGYTSGGLTAPGGNSTANGVFAYGSQRPGRQLPVRRTTTSTRSELRRDTTPLAVTTITPAGGGDLGPDDLLVAATFTRAVTPAAVGFTVVDGDDVGRAGHDQPTTPPPGPQPSTRPSARQRDPLHRHGHRSPPRRRHARPHQWSFTTADGDPRPTASAPAPSSTTATTRRPPGDRDLDPAARHGLHEQRGRHHQRRPLLQGPGNGGDHTVAL